MVLADLNEKVPLSLPPSLPPSPLSCSPSLSCPPASCSPLFLARIHSLGASSAARARLGSTQGGT
eukprot:3853705-Rhodomonas_salina.1